MTYSPTPVPDWRLSILGVDATRDLMPLCQSIAFIDNEHGEADEVTVVIEDDGRFINGDWLPEKGDRLGLRIGFEGASKIDCGTFEIDDQDFERRPNICRLRALSAPVSQALRTKRTAQYDETTLARIAGDVAARHGLSLVGEIADIPIRRRTQHDVTDLSFVADIAGEYGYVVKADAERLVFHELQALDALAEVMVLTPDRIAPGPRLSRSTVATYSKAVVEFTDPRTGETRRATVDDPAAKSGDTLRRHIEAESIADAERKAQAALYRANRAANAKAEITIEGTPLAAAGATVALSGYGVFDQRYKVTRATHNWRGGGAWTAGLSLQGVA